MITEKSIKELENSQAALTLTLDAASIEDAYSKRIQKYAKELQIPGFRKGKVPANVIERKFGEDIRTESTFDAMEDALKEAYNDLDEKDRPIAFSTPVLQDEEKLVPFKKDSDITFTVVYDVLPRFDLPQYTGLEVEVPSVEVTDADIEKEVERYREQNAVVKTKDGKAEKGDIVTVSYYEIGEDGNPIESTKREDFTFTLGTGYNFYKIDSEVEGMAKGDEKDIEKSYTEADNIPGYAGKTVKLHVKVTEVKVRELPAVDDLKKGIREDLEKRLENALKNEKSNLLLDKIIAEVSFPLPESMVQAQLDSQWRNFVRQSGLTEEQITKFMEMQGSTKESIQKDWREGTEKEIRTELILDKIREKENFEVDEEEFKKACDEQLKNIPEEDRDSYKDMIRNEMQYAKVLPYLLENNTFKENGKKSYGEYMEHGSED